MQVQAREQLGGPDADSRALAVLGYVGPPNSLSPFPNLTFRLNREANWTPIFSPMTQ
jgi:hypothetical protein